MKDANQQQAMENSSDSNSTTAKLNAKLIVAFRKRNRLTQKDLAEQMEVTTVAISRWERHESIPGKGNLKRLARIMQVGITDLIILPGKTMRSEWHQGNGKNMECYEHSKKARVQILSLLYEAHNLITEYISFIKKESELALLESILNNAIVNVRSQRQEIGQQELEKELDIVQPEADNI